MVDIQRPASVARNKKIRRIVFAAIAVVVVGLITIGLSRLKPAAPTVERATVWVDAVKRGPMVRQVRGLGTLVPEEIRWIPAVTDGRVDRILIYPGTPVTPDSVLLELSNPSQTQALLEAEQQLKGAEAQLVNLRSQLQNEVLAQEAAAASVSADFRRAKLQAEADAQLASEGLVSTLTTKLSAVVAENLENRDKTEQKRLQQMSDTVETRLAVQQSEVDRLRALLGLRRSQVSSLKVRPGMAGMLQQVEVQVGQQVGPGTNLARVADPTRLKAQLKIAETQAKDIQIGQVASIDTRNGVIQGRVSRIDPAVQNGTVTVDVALEGDLPRGARPDLSVDGTIELERLDDILYVGRPSVGQEDSTIQLFRLEPDGVHASRQKVVVGRASVNTVEVREGLKVGDQVILSDMSQFDAFDRVRLK
ncbi:MAG TPA: HlyD family efflux transporter periplasmic adaptor subunit [Vicinamibacterales bacterium]|nr:HlyD family efflux transporter periplasmic adaptor subunit [Vicinamibacterales bacterium]